MARHGMELAALVGLGLAGWVTGGALGCNQRIRTCSAGEEIRCDCPDGAQSVQVCGSDQSFEPCRCGEPGAGEGGAGGGADIPDFPEGARMIDVGPDRLVDAFRMGDLIQIVTRDQIRVVTMTGHLVSAMPSSSRNRAGAFDGERLAVANDETLRIFDPVLSEVFGIADLQATCMDMEFVHDAYLLCSPGKFYTESFVSYDATTAEPLVATPIDGTWEVGPDLYALPGTGDMLTVRYSIPPRLSLFRVAGDGSVVGVGESSEDDEHPFFGDVVVLGSPPSIVVTDKGARRSIYGDACKPELAWWDALCFEHQDFIGQPGVNRHYYAMVADGPDAYVGLFNHHAHPTTCTQGSCMVGSAVVHRYDLASATVTAEALIGEEMREPVRLLPDSDGGGAVVAYERLEQEGELPFPGYRVIWVPFE